MAKTNLISAVLLDTDKEAVKTNIAAAKTKLPFLVTLSKEERKKYKRKMGQKSVEYVNLNLRGAKLFGQYLLAGFDIADFNKDVTLLNQLWEVRLIVAAFLESIDDTIFASSVDAMTSADDVYDYLKKASENDASLKSLVDEIAKRFKGQGRKSSTPTNTSK